MQRYSPDLRVVRAIVRLYARRRGALLTLRNDRWSPPRAAFRPFSNAVPFTLPSSVQAFQPPETRQPARVERPSISRDPRQGGRSPRTRLRDTSAGVIGSGPDAPTVGPFNQLTRRPPCAFSSGSTYPSRRLLSALSTTTARCSGWVRFRASQARLSSGWRSDTA